MTCERAYPQEMQDALHKFRYEAAQIIDSFCQTLKSQTPPTLYHYTDDIGLKGILETGKLWLTDIFDLNDPSELKRGLSLGINALKNMVTDGPPERATFARHAASVEEKGIQRVAQFFACSFSSCWDDLGQWRAYADNGRGYALGFDATALEDWFGGAAEDGPNIGYSATFPVTYRDADLINMDRLIIERMLDLISLQRGKGLQTDAINLYMGDLSVHLMAHIVHAALFFEHAA